MDMQTLHLCYEIKSEPGFDIRNLLEERLIQTDFGQNVVELTGQAFSIDDEDPEREQMEKFWEEELDCGNLLLVQNIRQGDAFHLTIMSYDAIGEGFCFTLEYVDEVSLLIRITADNMSSYFTGQWCSMREEFFKNKTFSDYINTMASVKA
jgi:hypothetical protein